MLLNYKYRYRRYWPCIYSVSDQYLNLQYRTPLCVKLLFFLREAAFAIAMKIVSYIMATLVHYPLQKCSSVLTLTFVSHISKLLL